MLLGEILVREGYCDKRDVILALDYQDYGSEKKLGEILIERGILSYYQLVIALSIQAEMREKIKKTA